ncbi:MAG: hypothetical protein IT348_03090, partial [Candidatus Eisenbacteria bacterium]|nr:hypothetical protein [Candidatus Eisenbacteria bacterium]
MIGTTDAGAPEYVAPADPPKPAPSDVVELTEHYETDGELAELALELVNRAVFTPECEEQADAAGLALHRAWHTQRQAPLPLLLLMSRAL